MPYLPYTYLTFLQARQELALRLSDSGMVFWTDEELKLYIYEALRTWNAFTAVWIADFQFQAKATDPSYWYNLSTLAGNPRLYTVTYNDLFTLAEYHLLEPPTGFTWTGTSQFNINDLQQALEHRRDEVNQLTATGIVRLPGVPFPVPPYNRRTVLPDNVLEARRVRYSPATGFGDPVVLWREDPASFDFFTPDHLQSPQVPTLYSITPQPPLTIDTNFPPSTPGTMDVLAIQAPLTTFPIAANLVGVPDDWTWVVKWGLLADLLGKESEARDDLRAQYCRQRYEEGISLMQRLPWITQAQMDGVPVEIASFTERDLYDVDWELNAAATQGIIVAGTDFFAVCPIPSLVTRTPSGIVGISMQLVENAPLPVLDADPVEVSRDTLDVILDYAEHLAAFKQGGAEFTDTMIQFDNFRKSAQLTNNRLGTLPMYDDFLKDEGRREEDTDKRFTDVG